MSQWKYTNRIKHKLKGGCFSKRVVVLRSYILTAKKQSFGLQSPIPTSSSGGCSFDPLKQQQAKKIKYDQRQILNKQVSKKGTSTNKKLTTINEKEQNSIDFKQQSQTSQGCLRRVCIGTCLQENLRAGMIRSEAATVGRNPETTWDALKKNK